MKTEIDYFGTKLLVTIKIERYECNNRVAVVITQQGFPFGILSKNVPEVNLKENEFCAKTYSENADWATQILKLPIFRATDKVVKSGYVTMPVYEYIGE